jgi:sulfide:quinone oxidoreductase
MSASITPLRVVIAGGGIAALEALMALHDLGEQRLALTLIAPDEEFALRPMAVAVPFSAGHATHIALASICERFGATLHVARIDAVDAAARVVHCDDNARVPYDRLILATGAATRPAYRSALTFDDRDPTVINGLLADIDEGYCDSLAVVVPPSGSWVLPAYELALLIAREARGSSNDALAIHLVTPESEPLAVFGPQAGAAVTQLLHEAGVTVHTGAYAAIERAGEIMLAPGARRLSVSRVVALPAIVGRAIRGVPADAHGFIPVDDHGRVRGVDAVYAVGDGADFPVKQGGLAAQQADAAALHIAAAAGAAVAPEPFRPVLRGLLLTGRAPWFLRGEGDGAASDASPQALWWPPAKVVGRYLAPFLADDLGLSAASAIPPADAIGIEVELSPDRDARPLTTAQPSTSTSPR